MSDLLFTLIISEELATLSLQAGSRGHLQGSFIREEYLGVALKSEVQNGQSLVLNGPDRLSLHCALVSGTATEKLVPWIEVKPGFTAALAAQTISKANLSQWTADGRPVDLLGDSSLCCIEPRANNTPLIKLIVLFVEKVLSGRVHIVAAKPRLSPRFDGLAPVQALQSKRVAIVGVGSGGSIAAINLASAGVGKLHLFDKDDLSIDNVFRHACDLRHLGRAKVLAVKDLIESYDLPAEVIPHEQNVVDDAGDLWTIMDDIDLVVCATDTIQSRRLVNYVSVRTAVPLIMACTFRNALIGEIIRVRPGESPCYECTRLALSAVGALQLLPDADESATHVPYATDDESTAPANEVNRGSRADVSIVAALLSRIAISTLLNSEIHAKSLPTDYLVWGGTVASDLTNPFNFERPFSTTWVHLQRQKECPVCADFGKPIDQKIAETYQHVMASIGAKTN